ncbi:MAG: DUF1292 domain-containing protein [Anaerobutyricum sp.]|nr:DUF1292 domain-containing protein [Anaerobutyricum sp.]
MENNTQEYITFEVTAKDGTPLEMAVVDEFEYDRKHYVAAAVVKDDTINEDELYIYLSVISDDDFSVEPIADRNEYQKIAEAYLKM